MSKDFWRTPRRFVDAIEARIGKFGLDASATSLDCVAHPFLSPEDDALSVRWSDHVHPRRPRVWNNPPYSRLGGKGDGIYAWARKAVEARDDGLVVVVCVPPAPSTKYHRLLEAEGTIVQPGSRIPFCHPDTGVEMKGNRGDTMFAVLGPDVRGHQPVVRWDLRTEPFPAIDGVDQRRSSRSDRVQPRGGATELAARQGPLIP
jgi:phage N-6-adenine-methyltransferase